MEEGKFRRKIGWFQFLSCLMVIWTHAGNAELFMGKLDAGHLLMRLQTKFVPAVMRICIPAFIMISGYQFFRGFTMEALPGKWKRRIRTLLIPYVCWNLLYYFGYLAASKVPVLERIVNRPGLHFSLKDMFQAMIFYKSNPVFWFMYQLLLLVALAPVLYVILKNLWTGIVFLAVLLTGIFFRVSLPQLNLDALFYYAVAGYLAIHSREVVEHVWNRRRAVLGLVLLMVGIWIGRSYYTDAFIPVIVVYHVLAVFGLWLMVDEDWMVFWREWMGDTFFVYAFHFIVVRFVNKAAAHVFAGNGIVAALLYVTMPVLVIPVCCMVSWVMKRVTPALWGILNGGRGAGREAQQYKEKQG